MSIFNDIGDAISDGAGWIDENLPTINQTLEQGGQLLDTLGILDYNKTSEQVAAAKTQVGSSLADSNIGRSVFQDQMKQYIPWILGATGAIILIMVMKK